MKPSDEAILVPLTKNQLLNIADGLRAAQRAYDKNASVQPVASISDEYLSWWREEARLRALADRQKRRNDAQVRLFQAKTRTKRVA